MKSAKEGNMQIAISIFLESKITEPNPDIYFELYW